MDSTDKSEPPTARRRPKQQRAKAKYDAILQGAMRVLLSDGYAAASTVRIAEEAGVSVGTVYAYFTDKDEIFTTYVDQRISQIFEVIAANVSKSKYATAEEGIRDICCAAVGFTLGNRKTLSAMVGHIPGVYDGTMLRQRMDWLYPVAEDFFRAHGLVRDAQQARRMTYMLSSAVPGLFIRIVSDPNLPLEEDEIIEELVALMMGYIVRYRK